MDSVADGFRFYVQIYFRCRHSLTSGGFSNA